MTAPIVFTSAKLRKVEMVVPFKVAYGATTIAELTIVQIRDADGNFGLGEGAPPSYLSSEAKEQATAVAKSLAEGCQNLSVPDAIKYLDAQRAEVFEDTPIAFVAVETALWDLLARQQGRSLCDLFGGAKRQSITTDITLPLLDLKEVEPFWRLMQGHGFEVLKLKVSGNLTEDMDRIREILRVSPANMQIFLDGNQGFTLQGCLDLLRELDRSGVRTPLFFEQPLPKDAWDDFKALSEVAPIPICLDETVSTVDDMRRCIRDHVAQMVNLKLMKSGIAETVQIAQLGAAAKMPMMIGGMVESEITMTASLHLMCAMPGIQFADLDTPFFLMHRLCKSSPWHRGSAVLQLNQGPGHGLELT